MEIHQSNRKIEWLVWGAIVATVLVVAAFFVRSQIEQHRESQAGWPERSRAIDLRPIAQLPDFTLTNQDARAVSLADLRGQVWVADIIFTQCAGPCPTMTQRMSELQALAPVRLVTLTTDPEHDRPEVLKKYGERFNANFDR